MYSLSMCITSKKIDIGIRRIIHVRREFFRDRILFRALGIGLFYLLLSCIYTYPLVLHLGTKTINYTGKPWQHDWWYSAWVVQYGADILSHLSQLDLIYTKVFYPLGLSIGQATQIIATTILSLPLLQWVSLEATCNVLIIISLAASGVTSYILALHVLGSRWIALLTGWIFLSSPVMIAQASSHLILLSTLWAIPLYIVFLLKTIEDPKYTTTICLSLSAAILSLGFLYFLNMLFLFTAMYIVMCGVQKRLSKKNILHLVVSFTLYSPVLLVFIPFFMGTSQEYLTVSLEQVMFESVDLLGLILPDRNNIIFGSSVEHIREPMLNNPILHSVYVGWAVLVMSLLGVVLRKKDKNYLFFLFTAVIFTLLSLGPVIHITGDVLSLPEWMELDYYLPYMLYYKSFYPFVISDCSMFCILSMLFWSICAGFGIKYINDKLFIKKRKMLIAFCILFIFVDFFPKPHRMVDVPSTEAYNIFDSEERDFSVLHLPYRLDKIVYLYHQAKHNKNMLNAGYPRRLSKDHRRYAENFEIMKILKQAGTKDLEMNKTVSGAEAEMFCWFFDLKHIVVHKEYIPQEGRQVKDWLDSLLTVDLVYQNEHVQVYETHYSSKGLRPEDLPLCIDFDGHDAPLLMTGWSKPRGQGSDEWQSMNGSQAHIVIKINSPSVLGVRYRVRTGCLPQGHQEIRLYFNDVRVIDQSLESGVHEYEAVIPKDVVQAGHNTITFVRPDNLQEDFKSRNNQCNGPGLAFEQLVLSKDPGSHHAASEATRE